MPVNKFVNSLNKLESPLVMGILNTTPDSFSDGGNFVNLNDALSRVEQMIDLGVDIVDIGGESTRPGAPDVSEEDEISRVIPLLKAIKSQFNVLVSIDTSKSEVMQQSIDLGADIINDVRALQNKGCIDVVAKANVPVCLMHMQGMPRTMQHNPIYDNLIEDIKLFFQKRISICEQAGISRDRLILDPGFGFGKTLEQNYNLLANFSSFQELDLPLLSGTSRKSMIGNLLNRPVDERLAGSLTTALLATQQGAKIIRVHDVKETIDALKILAFTNANN